MGWLYERLIKSVKSCLKKCVGRASLSFDELHTTLVEIESVLNSRPLTYLYSDDLEEPLTPSHLILGRRILKLPKFEEDEEDDNPDKSVKSCLKKCVGRASLSFDELHTTLVEIESVLNSRPLTYLYSDDLEEPLTPSHLILGRRILKLPKFEEDEEDDNPDTALR